MKRLWLDDYRYPPPLWEDVVWVKTASEAIQALQETHFDVISLDHDLGDDPEVGDGYEVLQWMEEQVHLYGYRPPPQILIHSMNPVGHDRMKTAAEAILTASKFSGTVNP